VVHFRGAVGRADVRTAAKVFFFEKKKQKTFGRLSRSRRHRTLFGEASRMGHGANTW
jgi:hypothetical protein